MSGATPRVKSRAKPGSRPPTGSPRLALGVGLGLLLLRLFAGAFFVDTAIWKLFDFPASQGYDLGERFERFRADEYVPMVEAAIAKPPEVNRVPLTFYASFLEDVMLEHSAFFAHAILIGEALLGISLVLGIAVRLSASLGFLMMLAFSLAKFIPARSGETEHIYLLTVHSVNWAMTWICLALALSAAGRFVGLDAWLRPRLPRWLRWAC